MSNKKARFAAGQQKINDCCNCNRKPLRLQPVFPLHGDITVWRRQAKKLIDRANPTVVQAVYVLLLEQERQIKIRQFYKDML